MKPYRTGNSNGKVRRPRAIYSGGCGKLVFSSKKVAKGAAALARKETGETIEAYKCDQCHGWHMGHPIGLHRRSA